MILRPSSPFSFLLLVMMPFLGGMVMGGALVASVSAVYGDPRHPVLEPATPGVTESCRRGDGIACPPR